MLRLVEGSPEVSARLTPSRWFIAWLTAVHALLLLSLHSYAPAVGAGLGLIIVLHWACYLHRWGLRESPRRIRELEVLQRGVWVTCGRNRRRIDIVAATVWRGLIVIQFRYVSRGSGSLVILPDSCTPQEQRRLRVLLRHCLVDGAG